MNCKAVAVRTALLWACMLLLPVAGVAQDDPAGDQAEIWVVTIKDGMNAEFTAAFKDHLKFRARKKDPRQWRTYSPVIGDDLDHYVIRYCCMSHAELDSYQEWSGQAKTGEHWNENVDPYVASYRHYLQTVDFDNSNWPEDSSSYQLFGVTEYHHKMGAAQSIEATKTALSNAAKEGDWPRHWAWVRNSGGASRMELVVPYKNYADMAPGEESFAAFLARTQGESNARDMLQSFTDNFTDTRYSVYRYMPDMSMDN